MKQLCSQADYRGLAGNGEDTGQMGRTWHLALSWPRVACHVSRVNVMGTPGVIISPWECSSGSENPGVDDSEGWGDKCNIPSGWMGEQMLR